MNPKADFPKLVLFQGQLPPADVYSPAPDRLISGNPTQRSQNLFESADGKFNCGIWSSEPGKWRVVFTESEFCHLLEGTLIIRGDDGSEVTIKAGDAFVCPVGFSGTWEVTETARKFYAVYE